MTESMGTVRDIGTEGPKGIGGWLIVSLVILILSVLRGLSSLLAVAVNPAAAWTTPFAGMAFPSPLLDSVATAVQLGAAYLSIPLAVVCLVQFLRKSGSLPRLMIALYLLQLISIGIALAREIYLVVSFASLIGHVPSLARLVLFAVGSAVPIIWIRYFQVSKRVKATFVN